MERQNIENKSFIIGTFGKPEKPLRNSRSKWYVPITMYNESRFPIFCHGPTYGFTVNAAKPLFEASQRIPFLYLEDVFITGLCARAAQIPHLKDPDFTYSH